MARGRRVVTVSGGIDTASVLYFSLRDGYEVVPAILDMGHRNFMWEYAAAKQLVEKLRQHFPNQFVTDLIVLRVMPNPWQQLGMTWDNARTPMATGVTLTMLDEENFKQTFIPLRNVLMTVYMAILADKYGANEVAFGFCRDQEFYPDDNYEFTIKITPIIQENTFNHVRIVAPVGDRYRIDFVKEVYDDGFGWIYRYTFSCIGHSDFEQLPDGRFLHCGICEHCIDRRLLYYILEKEHGIRDEVPYIHPIEHICDTVEKAYRKKKDLPVVTEWWLKRKFVKYTEDFLENVCRRKVK